MHFDGGTTLKCRTCSLLCLRTKNINKGLRECTLCSTKIKQPKNTQWLCVCSLLGLDLPWREMQHHIEGHLDSLQYQHILQNVMLLSVWMIHPNGIIHFQQDHSSIHDSRVVQEWLSMQADVELIDWPLQAHDMNPIENMWSEVKRTLQETWPVLAPRNSYKLWTLMSDTLDEVASSQRYIRSLIESMTWRMKSVVEAQRFSTSY